MLNLTRMLHLESMMDFVALVLLLMMGMVFFFLGGCTQTFRRMVASYLVEASAFIMALKFAKSRGFTDVIVEYCK